MSYRILTEEEYALFSEAERSIYPGSGLHAWSDVRDRHDSEALARLWDDAASGVELVEDLWPDREAQLREVAMRVAIAQYYVLFGDLPTTKAES